MRCLAIGRGLVVDAGVGAAVVEAGFDGVEQPLDLDESVGFQRPLRVAWQPISVAQMQVTLLPPARLA